MQPTSELIMSRQQSEPQTWRAVDPPVKHERVFGLPEADNTVTVLSTGNPPNPPNFRAKFRVDV